MGYQPTTEMTPLLRRAVEALLVPADPESFDDGVYVNPDDASVKVVGTVREEVIAAACPLGVERVPGPCGASWEATVAVPHVRAEDFRGEIRDLLARLLRGVLGQFARFGGVRAIVWEDEQQEILLRFKVRGEKKEEP